MDTIERLIVGRKYADVSGIRWFTNIPSIQDIPFLPLTRSYSPSEYPTYVNYPAINVDKTCDIPADYAEEIGVPLSFLDKWNPEQFDLIACRSRKSDRLF